MFSPFTQRGPNVRSGCVSGPCRVFGGATAGAFGKASNTNRCARSWRGLSRSAHIPLGSLVTMLR